MVRLGLLFPLALCSHHLHAADDFPLVSDNLEVSLYARDPLVRNPCAITFDAKGRLCVGMGPQYRNPTPDTPGDSVWILIDEDNDGAADSRKQFATGFNAIQGLAWRGNDLYVANAPDLTIARDLDGDDEADEYVRLFTDLGNLEHALHGLQFGPDGKLYMSKGNSKGLTQLPDRVAPKPFRELWGVETAGAPDFPKPVVFQRGAYQKNYHDPADDWGLSGGILRCDPDGSNLEIVSRGFRNPWDICYDDSFDWLGTDNDQTHGDKIFAPFHGANFGWGHPWSYDWKGDAHLPSAPSSGPLFEGSGTGVIYCGLDHYPEQYRGVFLINDWLRREVYIYRPVWDGAWMQPDREKFDLFAHAGGGRSMSQSTGRSFDPVDIEVGPDGAIWISSWGREYGLKEQDGKQVNEGRIYRIWPKAVPPKMEMDAKRDKPIATWTTRDLFDDLGSHLPVWRTNAQEEMLRRGMANLGTAKPGDGNETQRHYTWLFWTLGRMSSANAALDEIVSSALDRPGKFVEPYQLIRILAYRVKSRDGTELPERLKGYLTGSDARARHEIILAMRQVGETRWNKELLNRIAVEQDRIVYYSAWGALRDLMPIAERKALLTDERPAVRRAGLLSLLEDDALSEAELKPLGADPDEATAALAAKRLGGKAKTEIRGPKLKGGSKPPRIAAEARPVSVVSSIENRPGRRYEEAVLVLGTRAYTDRPYRITALHPELEGLTFIRAANNDADDANGPFLKLVLRYPSTVYLADDLRGETLPGWARGKWEATSLILRTEDSKHRLYQAELPAGEITFGANRDGVKGRKGNYLVIVKPKLLTAPKRPTTAPEVMPLIKGADRERGRSLFLSKTGAACSVCHRLEGIGNIFAPDLAEIGKRADAAFLIRSILKPSAEITEGFAMQILTKHDGTGVGGIVLEETGRSVKMAMVDGSVVTVSKKDLAKRETAPISAMPPTFAGLLAPQDVADLCAYLLAPKEVAKVAPIKKPARPVAEAPQGVASKYSGKQWGDKQKGFYLDVHDVRIEIRYNGAEIGSYFYRHPETKRPFFAHVKTPAGLQVTRNFPPIEGTDATDHGTMHPGLWLGFANLDGLSFWHNNRGTVVMEEIVTEPTAGATASFAVKNRYLAPDGREICQELASYHFASNQDGYLLRIDSRFSGKTAFSFGVKEEMGLGIRVATPLTVKQGKGSILSASGGMNEKGTWGKNDKWWDYFGPLGGKSAGVQVMSGPGNPAVWSHSRDYGVLVANPFPVDKQENRGKKVTVKPGEEFRLRFGVQVHENETRDGYDPAAAFERYLKAAK